MSSKFAPDIPKSLIDAVSSIMNEAKADELPPIDKTEAQKRKERQAKLDAIEDKRAERDAGKEKPKSAVTKVSGTQYGGSKQKDDPEQQDEELKGNQSKIDANHNGKIDADDFKKLRGMKKENLIGGQKKLDKNHNGKLDSDDFKKLRGEEVNQIDEYGDDFKNHPRPQTSTPKPIGQSGTPSSFDKNKLKPASSIKPIKSEEVEQVAEVLTKKTPAKTWIHDFVHSKNPKFAGKSTKERQKMALGAYYGKKDESVNEGIVNHADIAKDLVKKHGKNVTMDHIDDYIDGADDAHKVDKREVLHHIKLLQDMNCESVQITEGKMKDIFTTMQMHATKKGYKNHKQFTPDDYHQMGKEHGISGQDLSVIAGHKTAAQAAEDLPFTPDKNPKKIAVPGKHGYGPSASKHLAQQGMKGLQKNSFDPDLSEGTGGPIYTKPLVKLGDLLARAKDMKNIKKATIVNPKDENQVSMKKEEVERIEEKLAQMDETVWDGGAHEREIEKMRNRKPDLVSPGGREKPNKEFRPEKKPIDPEGGPQKPRKVQAEERGLSVKESLMGKAGCTSEDDKKKDKKPVDYDKPTFLRKGGDWRKSNPAYLPKPKKEDVESTEDRHKREDEEERERKRKEQIAKNNKAFVRAVKRQKTPGASLGIAKDIQQRYYKTGKWEEVSIVESIEVKKEYDDKDETEHGVYHNGKKIGYVVHHKPSNTHTAYHSPSSYDKKGHADDYEEIDDFHNHKDAVNQIKSSALNEEVEEDVELDERVITPGTGTSPDPLLARTGLNKVLRKPRVGQTNLKNIPGGNLPGSQYKFSDDEKTKQRASLKTAIKSTLANKEHGVKRKLPEEIEQLDELDPKTYASYANKAVGDTSKDRSKMIKVADKKLYGNPDLRYKSKCEEVSIDETATLDKYIRSMGYDPQHLDKNKKVMFAKTNAYKTYAMSQEGLYDGGQKGTQDIDTHMSPGATARG